MSDKQKTDNGAVSAPRAGVAEAMPARKETFLARYPRNFKLGVLAILILVPVLIGLMGGPSETQNKTKSKIARTNVSGIDSKAAVANPEIEVAKSSQAEPETRDEPVDSVTGDSSTAEAIENDTKKVFMVPAPAPGLTEDTVSGSLPRVSEDGRQPWQVYARPFNIADKRPRIAIVITDLGLARVASDAAIDRLPPAVTLAFDVQSPVVGAWVARARQAGHETLLMLPMEPFDYPRSDPGPNTLLSNLPNSDNLQRLNWALSQAQGYVGITTLSGSHFTTNPDKITPVLDVLRQRGLMVFDAKAAPHSAIADMAKDAHVPVAVDTIKLDQNLSPSALDEALSRLEQSARLTGRAVAMAPPLPIILDRLAPWSKQLRKDGIALAPLSATLQ